MIFSFQFRKIHLWERKSGEYVWFLVSSKQGHVKEEGNCRLDTNGPDFGIVQGTTLNLWSWRMVNLELTFFVPFSKPLNGFLVGAVMAASKIC